VRGRSRRDVSGSVRNDALPPALAVHRVASGLADRLPAVALGLGEERILLPREEGLLAKEMAVVLDALRGERARLDRRAHRAAGLGTVRAVAKAAPAPERDDVLERGVDRRSVRP